MSDNNNSNGGHSDICGTLFLIFLVLKLCNVIDWSWWWITAPLWGPLVVVVIVVFLAMPFIADE